MIAAILTVVMLGAPPDSGLYVTFQSVMPDSGNIGTCAKPRMVPLPDGPLWFRYRLFGIPAANLYTDDSVRCAKRDTVRVSRAVPRWSAWIRYAWSYRYGMNGGVQQYNGCARPKLLVTRMVP